MRLFNYVLVEKPHLIVVNKVDLVEVSERKEEIEKSFTEVGLNVMFISAKTGLGVDNALEKVQALLSSVDIDTNEQKKAEAQITGKPETENPRVIQEGDVFVVEATKAERIVSRVDLSDRRVQIQLWSELDRLGVVRALEKAGAGTGSKVRFGETELDWE